MRTTMLVVSAAIAASIAACSSVDPGSVSPPSTGAQSGANNTAQGGPQNGSASPTGDTNGAGGGGGSGTPNPEPGSPGNPDDAGIAPETDAGGAVGDAGSGAHDGGSHDGGGTGGGEAGAGGGEAGAGGGAFGDVCQKDADCKSNACFIGGQGSYCSILCQTNAQCPVPPTSGTCNPKGYCKK